MCKVSWMALWVAWCGMLAVVPAEQTAKPAQGPSSRVPTIDQSLEWQSAFNPKISPDGKRVVYEVQKTNWEENAFERNLRSEEHTSELQSRLHLVCRLLLEKKKERHGSV